MPLRQILITDESAAYRHQLRLAIDSLDGYSVAGEASTGRSAVQFMELKRVDCLILNFDLPDMNGIDVIRAVRRSNPDCKIMMLARGGQVNAVTTMNAMSVGADELVAKPAAEAGAIKNALARRITLMFNPEDALSPGPRPMGLTGGHVVDWRLFRPKIIVVGSSTGGPVTLEKFLLSINGPLICPMVIVQHMPAGFTASLAARLTEVTGRTVVEAKHGQTLDKQTIFLAPGDFHLRVRADDKGVITTVLDQSELRNFVRPAVDHLFESAASTFGSRCLGIVLTGMGQDGLEGARAIKTAGGAVAIQDKASSVVFGMPAAVQAGGLQDFTGDPPAIGALLNRMVA